MDAYFARQPILDSQLHLFGYELLYRPNPKAQAAGDTARLDGDYATASVLDAVNLNGIEKVTRGSYAFVNFTQKLLLEGVASLYPREYLAVEILESVKLDKEVLAAVEDLKAQGYLIVLDDYIYAKGDEPLLALSDIVKVEVDGSDEAYKNLDKVRRHLDLERCRLLAEKVETQAVFKKAAKMGCTLFQGYFFARPKTMSNTVVNPIKINQLRLMQEITKPDFDFNAIADIIKNDVGLSYKTLRLVNSVYYGALHKIDNINQAVVFLGKNELKKWLVFQSLHELGDNSPPELIIMSMIRAHFCEQVAKATHRKNPDAYFLAGLFSLLDAITETPLETCLGAMSVPPIALEALLGKDNAGRHALDLIIALEQGDWGEANKQCASLKLNASDVSAIYVDAIDWARQFS